MTQPPTVPVSVIIPACDRVNVLLNTIDRIEHCIPQPAEILVHVDGSAPEILELLRGRSSKLTLLSSTERQGAGGSRNVLIKAAAHEWVASFDDDSYPLDKDYFLRVLESVKRHPDVAVIGGTTMELEWDNPFTKEIAVYTANVCIFNREWFLRTNGFVPLPFAYAMEEVDLSLQLHVIGGRIMLDTSLRAKHPPLVFSGDPRIESQIFCNTVLFPFLRYPILLWWHIPMQMLGRMLWLARNGCAAAILPALQMLPGHLWKYRRWRRPVPLGKVLSWLRLRKRGPAAWKNAERRN